MFLLPFELKNRSLPSTRASTVWRQSVRRAIATLVGGATIFVVLFGVESASAQTEVDTPNLQRLARHRPPQAVLADRLGETDLPARAVATGKVEVAGGMVTISADGPGVVKAIMVTEGQSLEAGAPMIELERQVQAHALAYEQYRLQQARADAEALKSELPFTRQRVEQLRRAVSEGGVERSRYDDARAGLAKLSSRQKSAAAAINTAVSAVSAAQWEFDRRLLRAPVDGKVVAMHATVGVSTEASANKALAVLLPMRELQVRVELNEYFVDAVSIGMKARVVPDGSGASEEISAEVLRVGDIYQDSLLGERAEGGSVRTVAAVVSLPSSAKLKVGQRVRVSFYD